MRIIYLTAIVFLGIISSVVPMGTSITYGSNNPLNQACYNSGFADGQKNTAYNQGQFTQCGVNGKAYYEGFINGCISGQGKSFFSCQQLTNSPLGGGSTGSSSGIGSGSGSIPSNNNNLNTGDQNDDNNDQNNDK